MDNDERNETNFSRFLSTERSDDTSPGTQPERRPNPGGRFDMRTLFVFCLLLYVVFDRCPSDSFVPVSASPLIRPCCCVHVTLLMIDDRTDIPLSRGSVVAQNVRLFQFAFHVFVDAVRVKHRRQPYDVCVCSCGSCNTAAHFSVRLSAAPAFRKRIKRTRRRLSSSWRHCRSWTICRRPFCPWAICWRISSTRAFNLRTNERESSFVVGPVKKNEKRKATWSVCDGGRGAPSPARRVGPSVFRGVS